jgi:hypothetical protein
MQAKNFHADKNDRRALHTGGPRVIDRHVASGYRHFGISVEALGVGVDDIGAYWPGGEV